MTLKVEISHGRAQACENIPRIVIYISSHHSNAFAVISSENSCPSMSADCLANTSGRYRRWKIKSKYIIIIYILWIYDVIYVKKITWNTNIKIIKTHQKSSQFKKKKIACGIISPLVFQCKNKKCNRMHLNRRYLHLSPWFCIIFHEQSDFDGFKPMYKI